MLLCYVIDSGLSTSLLLLATLIIMFYIYIYIYIYITYFKKKSPPGSVRRRQKEVATYSGFSVRLLAVQWKFMGQREVHDDWSWTRFITWRTWPSQNIKLERLQCVCNIALRRRCMIWLRYMTNLRAPIFRYANKNSGSIPVVYSLVYIRRVGVSH